MSDGKIPAAFIIYADDVWLCGGSWEEVQKVTHQIASFMTWLGMQDAPRKRRDPYRTPGPGADSIIHTKEGVITASVSHDRWDKARAMLSWIESLMMESDTLEHKQLES